MTTKVKTSNTKNIKKPTPFYAVGSTTPISKEEMERRRIRYQRLMKLGINPTKITQDDSCEEHENPYRVEIMVLINQDKEIPQELIEKMRAYDKTLAEKYRV